MSAAEPYIVPHCPHPVDMLYADAQLLMVNKPSGLLSVPGRHPANRDCLVSRVQQSHPEARIIHRLDMATSGVMVLARDADSHRQLSRQFELRKPHKAYEAVVQGLVEQSEGSIDLPICCDWPNRPRQKVDYDQGKPALTHYRVLARDHTNHCTRLLLTPHTGRSHQLRIHLASIGHPILGCEFYGGEASALAPRLLLHARELRVEHPLSGRPVCAQSPCPF